MEHDWEKIEMNSLKFVFKMLMCLIDRYKQYSVIFFYTIGNETPEHLFIRRNEKHRFNHNRIVVEI